MAGPPGLRRGRAPPTMTVSDDSAALVALIPARSLKPKTGERPRPNVLMSAHEQNAGFASYIRRSLDMFFSTLPTVASPTR
jgi:hypothetical protein